MSSSTLRNREVRTVSLLDIARTGTIGPFSIGAKLSVIGDLVGPPTYWGGFNTRGEFSFVSKFRNLEIGVKSAPNDLEVAWAEFWLDDFSKHEFRCTPNSKEMDLTVLNPFRAKRPMLGEVVTELNAQNLLFKFGNRSEDDGDTVLVFGNGAVFYFEEPPLRRLVTVSLTNMDE